MKMKRSKSEDSIESDKENEDIGMLIKRLKLTTIKEFIDDKWNKKSNCSNILQMNQDVLQICMSFLTQHEVHVVSNVSKYCRIIAHKTVHFKYYEVNSTFSINHVQQQSNLQVVKINKIQNIERWFYVLPNTIHLNNCSFLDTRQKFPSVEKIVITEGNIDINWKIFPMLQELNITTSQPQLNLDSIYKCKLLRRIYVNIIKGLVYIGNKKVTMLPLLETFEVKGSLSSKLKSFKTLSPYLKKCVFFANPRNRVDGCEYINNYNSNIFT